MTRTRVELLGGPDCGHVDSLTLPGGGVRPLTLPDHEGRRRYHDAHQERGGRHVYAWEPEVAPALLRATCEQHQPARPGCPGYRPRATAAP